MKPIVHYTMVAVPVVVGANALVATTDHPSPLVSNTTYCRTSPVVAITKAGFETENTLYEYAGRDY